MELGERAKGARGAAHRTPSLSFAKQQAAKQSYSPPQGGRKPVHG